MTAITKIQVKIDAIEIALGSFVVYESSDEERRNVLKQHFSGQLHLMAYLAYSVTELKNEKKRLEENKLLLLEEENQLLAQQHGRNLFDVNFYV